MRSSSKSHASTNRRQYLKHIAVGSVVAIAGCSGQSDNETTTTADENNANSDGTTNQTATEANQKAGGHLRVQAEKAANSLNPLFTDSFPENRATGWMYSKLTRPDHNLQPQPDLATNWKGENDSSEWVFELREGVKFNHNGQEVTAEDVKATLETIQDEEVGSPGMGSIGPIDQVVIEDDYRARIVLNQSFSALPKTLSKQYPCIIPADIVTNDREALEDQDFGSGPFRLEEWEGGSHMKFSSYDDFHLTDSDGNQLPYVDEITMTIYPDFVSEFSDFQSKNLDLVYTPPPNNWNQYTEMSGVDTNRKPGGLFYGAAMRSDEPPFDDNRVRKAVKLGIDRQAHLETVINGIGSIAYDSPISPSYELHSELPGRERDLDQAQTLLNEAGYGDGFEVDLYASNSPSARADVAVLMKEQLQPLGIDITVQQISHDRFLSDVWQQAPFFISHYGQRISSDILLYTLLHSEGPWNETHWHDDEFDQALESMRKSSDRDQRAADAAKLQEILFERGPYAIPFFIDTTHAKWDYVKEWQDTSLNEQALTAYGHLDNSTYLSGDAPTRND